MFQFAGSMSLLFDPKIVCDMMMNNPSVKVISLDEDNAVPMLSDENNPQVVPGTVLLPPIEAMWAIVDEQEEQFAQAYYMHLVSPECMQYIAALLSAAYRGYNVIFYYPNESDKIINYLYNFLMTQYGIRLAVNAVNPFAFDKMSVPLYCNSMFSIKGIGIGEYLQYYPNDAKIPDVVYLEIIKTLSLPGDTLADKMKLVDRLRRVLKINPRAMCPIIELD